MVKGMPRKSRPRTLPKNADVPDAIVALERERATLQGQREEMQTVYDAIRHSTKWTLTTDEDWEYFMSTIKSVVVDIDNNLDYIDNQLDILRKGVKAFETDDPEAIKKIAKEYLLSDVSLSLKNLALHRYDNSEIIRRLTEYDAM
jgi:hypothetical protein